MALVSLVYRDQLFPREVYRQMYEKLLNESGERSACKTMVELLAIAHEQGCEAALGAALQVTLQAGELAQLDELRTRFAPKAETLPCVKVDLPSLCGYDALLATPSEPANQPVKAMMEVLP